MVASGLQSQQQMLGTLQWFDTKHSVFRPHPLRYRGPRLQPAKYKY